jgi:hypothetical protein
MFGTVVTSDWGRGKTTVLWAVARCSLVDIDHDHRGAFYLHLLPLWRQKVSLTHWYCYTRLHSITHQKTVISEEHQVSQDAKVPSMMIIIHRRVLTKVCVMLCCSSCASELKLIVLSCLSLTWASAQINSCGAMGSLWPWCQGMLAGRAYVGNSWLLSDHFLGKTTSHDWLFCCCTHSI